MQPVTSLMQLIRGSSAPVVRVSALDFFYGQSDARNQVLFDISIEIPPGQFVVMTGPSGSGKTTLLTLMGGLRSMQQGRLEILGRDVTRLTGGELVRIRREIGFIFQMHNLFDSLTAIENVRMALQLGTHSAVETQRRAQEILGHFGLSDRINYKPRQLSGGQRQRVAIARALANRPKLVLADEPTAALDMNASRNVVSRLKEMTVENHSSILMVTHDHRIIEVADRLVHMVDGRIISDVLLDDALRICEFLKGVESFKTLTPAELTNIAEHVRRRHFDKGEVVIRQGDVGEELFLISEGEVEVLREDHEIARLGPADFFGELSLISGEPRNATVVATTSLDTYVLGKTEFRAAMDKSSSFREQLRRVYFQRH
jgi:putative ABC transport system ATP-binding protein